MLYAPQLLTDIVKVPDYNNLRLQNTHSKEDERSVTLARRAQSDDYDEGALIPDQANDECA